MKGFARRVNEIARASGARTVLIATVWDRLGLPHWEAFQRDLLQAHCKGDIELARSDLRSDLDPEDLEASTVRAGAGVEYNVVVAPRQNPGRPRDDEEIHRAIACYEGFHRHRPRQIGEMDLRMPRQARKLGHARYVLYRSDKVDPETGKKPGRAVDYIHEHDAGVHVYALQGAATDACPKSVTQATGLVLLGRCLGLAHDDLTRRGQICELEARAPLPELYCTPDGRCLVVVQDQREILFLVWGGALGVEPRGIVG
jgi:hypothetical protein